MKCKTTLKIIFAVLTLFIVIFTLVGCASKHVVTYDLNGGSMEETKTTVKYGSSYDLPFPTKSGMIFSGWYYGDEYVEAAGKSWRFDKDVTLTARWVIKDSVGFVYEEADGGYIISDYKGTASQYIVAPLQYNDKPIVAVSDNTFARLEQLSADIESTIISICLPKGCQYNDSKLGFTDYVNIAEYNIVGDDSFLYADCGDYLSVVCYLGGYDDTVLVKSEYNGKPVKELGINLFYGAQDKIDHTSYTFPRLLVHENINKIGKNAFAQCNGLKVSLYYNLEDGSFREVVDLARLFDWSQSVAIEDGNEQLLDVITQIRAAFGWSIYTNAGFYVRLDSAGGIVVSDDGKEINSLTLKRAKSYVLPTPTREGYTFGGWYYGDTLVSQSGERWIFSKHIELTAKWIEN